MYRLIFLLFSTSIFSAEIYFSYFDKVRYEENNISTDQFFKKIDKKDIDSGFILVFSYPLNQEAQLPLSIHAGTSIARWDFQKDESYAYSTYLSARFSPISIALLSPYVEVSFAGPTYLSKQFLGEIDFGSPVVYQNYIAAGIKFASFIVDIKMLNYSSSLSSSFTSESITMPIILSAGCSY
jgi:hypothetical protein